MMAYIDKCLEGRSPATDDLFITQEEIEALSEARKKMFQSDVAKLLYLGKRTKRNILTAVSHLSSRVDHPTEDDQQKLD